MVFHSVQYLVFLGVCVGIFHQLPNRHRMAFLLLASWVFYAFWRIDFLLIVIASTLLDYICGILIHRSADPAQRKLIVTISIVGNIGALVFFRYLADAIFSITQWLAGTGAIGEPIQFNIILALGISFYTFQSLSYTIDVFRGQRPAEKNFIRFAAYVSLFPQLLAGPIERSTTLMPQLARQQTWSNARAFFGIALITIGLFKKMVIADRLHIATASMYADPSRFSDFQVTLLGPLELYRWFADASGYADIAIGSALLFGFRLSRNFRRPFFAGSVGEFWRRWHITIGTWFRDYLILPLISVLRGRFGQYAALITGFLMIGLWHQASWMWITIGLSHGLIMAIEFTCFRWASSQDRLLKSNPNGKHASFISARLKLGRATHKLIYPFCWFAILVLSGLLAGAYSMSQFFEIVSRYSLPTWKEFTNVFYYIDKTGLAWLDFMVIVAGVLMVEIWEYVQDHEGYLTKERPDYPLFIFGVCAIAIPAIIFLGVRDQPDFIYFGF